MAAELSLHLTRNGRSDEAKRALLIAEAATEDTDPPVQLRHLLLSARGAFLESRDRHPEAVEVFQRAVTLARSELGEDHPVVARLLGNLSIGQQGMLRFDEAMQTLDAAIDLTGQIYGLEHPRMAALLAERATTLVSSGRAKEAIRDFEKSIELHAKASGPFAPSTVRVIANLATAMLSTPEARDLDHRDQVFEEVRVLLQPVADRLEAEGRIDERGTTVLWDNLGGVLVKQGRVDEGIKLVGRAVANVEQSHGPNSIRLVAPLSKLTSAYRTAGRYDDARRVVERAIQVADPERVRPSDRARLRLLQGEVEESSGHPDKARRAFEAGRDIAAAANAQGLVDAADLRLGRLPRQRSRKAETNGGR